MYLRNKKTGEVVDWSFVGPTAIKEYEGEDVLLERERYESIEEFISEWEDYIPSAQRDYRKEVKMLLAAYLWEIYKEGDEIYDACGGRSKYDGRKHVRESAENMGRLYALRDIARALGMSNAERIGIDAHRYYDDSPHASRLEACPNEDVKDLKYVRMKLGDDFYRYGFKEEK